MKHKNHFFFTLLWIFLSINALAQPSFDCNKAKSTSEKIICNDSELSNYDNKLFDIYKKAKAISTDLSKFNADTAAAWKYRQEKCNDKPCIKEWYEARINFYSEYIKISSSSQKSIDQATSSKSMDVTAKFPNEITDAVIQENPKRKPLISRDGHKYWNCQGLVDEGFMNKAYSGIKALEKLHGLSPSQISTCIYLHDSFKMGDRTVVLKSINFYTSDQHQQCIYRNNCGDMRSISFYFGMKPPSFSYDLSNKDGSVFYGACTSMRDGTVLSADKNCMAMK